MRKLSHFLPVAMIFFALLPTFDAGGQEARRRVSAGVHTFLRGAGFTAEFGLDSGEYCSISLCADVADLIFAGSDKPGIRANWTHSFIVEEFDNGKFRWMFHAGPGVSAGYVRSRQAQWGAALALSGNAGMVFSFRKDFAIDLSWTAELGGQLVNSGEGNPRLLFYLPGIQRTIYPELKFLYRFR